MASWRSVPTRAVAAALTSPPREAGALPVEGQAAVEPPEAGAGAHQVEVGTPRHVVVVLLPAVVAEAAAALRAPTTR